MDTFGRRLWAAASNFIILGAVVFTAGALYLGFNAGHKKYPVTAAQRAYGQAFCVNEQHGAFAEAYVTKPDLFGSNGSSTRLSIRCSFGHKAFMLKTVDIASARAVPH